jgi:multidrug efflux pump subunit AcrA (membrane-fusion protein)
MRRKSLWSLFGLVAFAVLGMAGPATAAPITFTQSQRFVDSFTGTDFPCQEGKLYEVTVSGTEYTHLTARTDADGNIVPPLRFHDLVQAKVVAVPVDGTGVSYVGHFRASDSETIRSVKHGQVLAETDSDQNKASLQGSDGSRAVVWEHHHFTVNANGEVSIEFDHLRVIC